MEQDYTFWRAQLAGENPAVTPGEPQAGYYRTPSHQAVVIWYNEELKPRAQTTSRNGSHSLIRDPDAIDELFSRICRSPVEGDTYSSFRLTKTWPEDVKRRPAERGIGDNSAALAPHERVRAEI